MIRVHVICEGHTEEMFVNELLVTPFYSKGIMLLPAKIYEFEALLFSHPQALAEAIQQPGLADSFTQIRQQFATPEEINDSPQTAPGKRIEKLYNAYDKPVHPVLAAREIGLETICRECPLFNEWVTRLEALVNGGVA